MNLLKETDNSPRQRTGWSGQVSLQRLHKRVSQGGWAGKGRGNGTGRSAGGWRLVGTGGSAEQERGWQDRRVLAPPC